MAFTLGTNSTGYDIPGATNLRGSVRIRDNLRLQTRFQNSIALNPFIGAEDSGLPIIQKTELTKQKGDTIRLHMQGFLSGRGTWGNGTLEGNEEVLDMYKQDVVINQIRNAIVDDGKMSQQRGIFDIHKRSEDALAMWFGQVMDDFLFNAAYYKYPPHTLGDTSLKGYNTNSGQITPARHWFAADEANNPIAYSATDATFVTNIQTAEGQLSETASDKFGPEVLEAMAAKLKVENIQEVNFNGFQGYIAIIHPYQTAQLRTNTNWFDAHMNAGPRDEHNNLIFKGHMANNAVGLWNNIMLFESNKVHAGDQSEWTDLISGDSGSNTVEIDSSAGDVRRALFFGQNAVSLAVGKDPSIITKKDFDYFEHQGEAVNAIFGMERFEPLIDTSATDIVSQGMMVLSTFSPATQA